MNSKRKIKYKNERNKPIVLAPPPLVLELSGINDGINANNIAAQPAKLA